MTPHQSDLDQLRIHRAPEDSAGGRTWLWILGAVVLAVVLLAVLWWFLRPKAPEVTLAVARTVASEGGGTVLNATGYVTARRQATVSSKVTGKVLEILIEEGMKVEKGEVLARLDTSNIRASLELARAQLSSARSALRETQVRLAEARLDLKRIRSLVEEEIASQADLDAAQAEEDSLEARLLRQRDEVSVAERSVEVYLQELEDRIIRAPFSGVVVAKNAQEGEMISPAAAGGGFTRTGIGTLVDMASLEIEVDVNEAYIGRVSPEQPVTAVLDAYPDWEIPGRVIAIIPTADRQRATVKVRVGFDRLDPRILPDMGVKVAFLEETEGGGGGTVVEIPEQAVRKDGTRSIVWIFQDGTVERRAVRLGAEEGDVVQILSGLRGGERVIVDSPRELKDGETVKPRST